MKIGIDFLNRGGGADKAWQEYCQVLLVRQRGLFMWTDFQARPRC